MKWNVSVGVRLSINYDDIEAETREEAEQIAKDMASEDIDYNNADCDEEVFIYSCYSDEDLDDCSYNNNRED